jgi:hypothetical protein
MVALAGELANPGQSAEGRQQAGLQLKQCLKSKDADVSAQYEANWLALDEGTRSTIKGSVWFRNRLPIVLSRCRFFPPLVLRQVGPLLPLRLLFPRLLLYS